MAIKLSKALRTSLPLYLQIAESLTDQIESGSMAPNTRLPAEREFCAMLGINRMTLRQALSLLEAQGLIERRQGKGTFVAAPKIEREAGRLEPFTWTMQRQGYVPGARLILFERRYVEASAARELNLPISATVYYGHRLRLINQEPVMLERFTIPADRFPGFEKYDLSQRSIYEVMESEYGVSVVRARQSLEPIVASEYEAQLLGIEIGAPLMLERRVGVDQEGEPVEYGKDAYRGDRFRFVTQLAPIDR